VLAPLHAGVFTARETAGILLYTYGFCGNSRRFARGSLFEYTKKAVV